jgi:hypothetical protein
VTVGEVVQAAANETKMIAMSLRMSIPFRCDGESGVCRLSAGLMAQIQEYICTHFFRHLARHTKNRRIARLRSRLVNPPTLVPRHYAHMNKGCALKYAEPDVSGHMARFGALLNMDIVFAS